MKSPALEPGVLAFAHHPLHVFLRELQIAHGPDEIAMHRALGTPQPVTQQCIQFTEIERGRNVALRLFDCF